MNYWWLIRVTLVVAFGFLPKILGDGGDLQIVILLEKECSFSGADTVRWWGHTQILLGGKKLNFMHL